MKYLFIALSIFFCCYLCAQDRFSNPPDTINDNNIILHAEASNINFHAWKLNDIFVAGGGQRFPAFTTIGLGILISEDYDNFRYEWNCAFHYYLPFNNETTLDGQLRKTRLHGWEFLTCRDGYDIVPAKLFDVSGGLGFYCGNLKLDYGASRYTNPFIAPMAKIDLRVNFWKISIGARASGRFDLTAPIWKRHSNGMLELPGYKFRELQAVAYIGWFLWSQ